ncbi:Cilia- and flagella-associated protein 65 [Camelus dromedarius]|nr:Cilia- and flagella-associated protein 65 [Camelus dromedarius]
MDTQVCFSKKQEKVKKRVIWGIEVAEKLQWKGWELGKEITKNLVLKNLSLKIQKIKYRPPKTKFFFTVIPQPIFLSPGITLSLPIIFRPLEEVRSVAMSGGQGGSQAPWSRRQGQSSKELPYHTHIPLAVPLISDRLCLPAPTLQKEYTDQLWFEKAEGMFCVELRATLPCHNLICPPSLQLPMCAMGDMAEAWFCLDNVG